jgi:hypothetical protein
MGGPAPWFVFRCGVSNASAPLFVEEASPFDEEEEEEEVVEDDDDDDDDEGKFFSEAATSKASDFNVS